MAVQKRRPRPEKTLESVRRRTVKRDTSRPRARDQVRPRVMRAMRMEIRSIIEDASRVLKKKVGYRFEQLEICKPKSRFEAVNLLKITSKLSPFVGNLFEIEAVETMTGVEAFKDRGTWVRQDPDFPDVLFRTGEPVEGGFEVKAWYPFATEITGRFKDSQNRFAHDQTYVLMFAWVPEHMLYGRARILDLCIVSARSVAAARDEHYHKPPDYLVIEPLDTSNRTRNLQQTNTSGYKFQGTPAEMERARKMMQKWGKKGEKYRATPEYQEAVRELQNSFKYRLDTNYAKIDRVFHAGLESFKARVMATTLEGRTIAEWSKLFRVGKAALANELQSRFQIAPSPSEPPLSAAPAPSGPLPDSESDDE